MGFKSYLGQRKQENPKSKSEGQISVIKSVQNFLDLRVKAIN